MTAAPIRSELANDGQRPLAPVWNWESTGTNGGKIIGTCKTPKELGEMVAKLAEHPETESIRIGKCRRDYDPMLPGEKMWEIISANGDERKAIMRELANESSSPTAGGGSGGAQKGQTK
jgi:hypothetical protein